MLRSPELMDRAQRLGEYLRFQCTIPEALREFAILVCAREWQQTYEWAVHAPLAEKAGVSATTIDELANGSPLSDLTEEQGIIYRYCSELLTQKAVSDATWKDALDSFGETGAIELCGLCGYYSMLAMVMNASRTAVPAGTPALPFALPRVADKK